MKQWAVEQNGKSRVFDALRPVVQGGVLLLQDVRGGTVAAFAEGHWSSVVEIETGIVDEKRA